MAKYNQVSYGSQGDDVKELQELLNKNGANLTVDGIYGSQTQQAVKDYQKSKNLAVDGIVGDETWGSLTTGSVTASKTAKPITPTTPKPQNQNTPATNQEWTYDDFSGNKEWSYDDFAVSDSTAAADKKRQEIAGQKPGDFSYDPYQKSDAVLQAEALLQQQLGKKPGEYESQWQATLDETLNKILNREKFSYDLNGDALYQQYKDQYMLQGQQAMMDTMGQVQAMTGGYGNSYAQTVGQQTYQGYLQQLNDKVPELYQLALNQYNREGEELYKQYGLYADRENQDYNRYRDTVSDYYTELDRLTEDARYKDQTDYNRYQDAYDRAYGQHRDQVGDWQYEQSRADEDYWNQYDRDYQQYSDDRNLSYDNHWNQYDRDYQQYSDDRNLSYDNYWNEQQMALNEQQMDYQKDRDKVADEQWQKEFDEAKRQYDEQMALKSGGSSGGSGGSGGGYTKNPGLSEAEIRSIQRQAGITEDGIWGPQTAAAYDKGTRPKAEEKKLSSYAQLKKDLDAIIAGQDANGSKAAKGEISAIIREAVRNGEITENQAQQLLSVYAPRGYTY